MLKLNAWLVDCRQVILIDGLIVGNLYHCGRFLARWASESLLENRRPRLILPIRGKMVRLLLPYLPSPLTIPRLLAVARPLPVLRPLRILGPLSQRWIVVHSPTDGENTREASTQTDAELIFIPIFIEPPSGGDGREPVTSEESLVGDLVHWWSRGIPWGHWVV